MQTVGLSSTNLARVPLELSFHVEEGAIRVKVCHSDVFQVWDATQLEEEVWRHPPLFYSVCESYVTCCAASVGDGVCGGHT